MRLCTLREDWETLDKARELLEEISHHFYNGEDDELKLDKLLDELEGSISEQLFMKENHIMMNINDRGDVV